MVHYMGSSRLAERIQLMAAQDPDASNEDTDEVLTRQFTAFGDALGDECPVVRAEAVTGLAGLLDTFWELVPAAATAGFLQRIAGEESSTLTKKLPQVLLPAMSTGMSLLPTLITSLMNCLGSSTEGFSRGLSRERGIDGGRVRALKQVTWPLTARAWR